ncbi:hypothetical protein JHK86_054189 [Glycine max]|nr:hypothetical protein JHK86_054189 [Glycine max]
MVIFYHFSTISVTPTFPLLHSFLILSCLCYIVFSLLLAFHHPFLSSIHHHRSYACVLKFPLKLKRYLFVVSLTVTGNTKTVLYFIHSPLESYGLYFPLFLVSIDNMTLKLIFS